MKIQSVLSAILAWSAVTALPIRETRGSQVGAGTYKEHFVVAINISDMAFSTQEQSVKNRALLGMQLDYVLSVGDTGMSNHRAQPIDHSSNIDEQVSALPVAATIDHSSSTRKAIVHFEDSKITAEVRARIEETNDHHGSTHAQVVVATRIIEVLGDRITTQAVLHVFPLRSVKLVSRRTPLYCRMMHLLHVIRHGKSSVRHQHFLHEHTSVHQPSQIYDDSRAASTHRRFICRGPETLAHRTLYVVLTILTCYLFIRLLLLVAEFVVDLVTPVMRSDHEMVAKDEKADAEKQAESDEDLESLPMYDPDRVPQYTVSS